MQTPAWQVSVCVHALPSLHGLPSGFAELEQIPVAGLQVPPREHELAPPQTTGFDPVQFPPWQVSVWVQASPSLQPVPSALAGFEHVPVAGLHVPEVWHAFEAVHTTGLLPTQAPAALQVSVCVHALLSLHVVPAASR